jgi:hypothetical protein
MERMTAPLIMMGGHSDNREYELAVVREAIAAKTDPALGADIPNAAEHLLRVLDDCEFRDERGKLRSRGNSTDLSWFFYFVWRRIIRKSVLSSRSSLGSSLGSSRSLLGPLLLTPYSESPTRHNYIYILLHIYKSTFRLIINYKTVSLSRASAHLCNVTHQMLPITAPPQKEFRPATSSHPNP